MFPFSSKNYVLLLLDGESPLREFFRPFYENASSFIAVDGAASWALENAIAPDLVIGDLDSFKRRDSGLALEQIAEQESNDFEKALRYVINKGHQNIMVFGAFGLRADHLLSNFFVLKKYAHLAQIVMLEEKQMCFMCPARRLVRIFHEEGAYLSLFPLGHAIGPIKSQGLLYPLDNEMLSLHHRIGTLNKIIDDEVAVCSESEGLLIFVPYHDAVRIIIE